MSYEKIDVRAYSSAIGAEIFGVDLSQPLDNHTWSEIHQAFHDHLVIFFRDQHITPDAQLAFARHFGELEPYPFVHGIDGYPELIEIVKMPDETRNFGSPWHIDMSFREKTSARCGVVCNGDAARWRRHYVLQYLSGL